MLVGNLKVRRFVRLACGATMRLDAMAHQLGDMGAAYDASPPVSVLRGPSRHQHGDSPAFSVCSRTGPDVGLGRWALYGENATADMV